MSDTAMPVHMQPACLARRERCAGIRAAASLAVAVALTLLAGAPGVAGEEPHGENEISRSQAAALVSQRYSARVVRASSAEEGGRHLYVFRLLSPAGKIWEVRVDARSGMEVR